MSGKRRKDKKTVLESLSFMLAGFAFLVGIVSMFMPLFSDKRIPAESLYWFFFALIAILFPYIKEITLHTGIFSTREWKRKMEDDLNACMRFACI